MIHPKYFELKDRQDKLLRRPNSLLPFYNGIVERYEYPVLTADNLPIEWKYDLNAETNPFFMYLAAPIETPRMTGAFSSSASKRTALVHSRLLMLNWPTA